MSAMFKEYIFESDDFYRIGVYAGKAAHWRRCKVCGQTIKAMSHIICVHTFGEAPGFFHPECITKIIKALIIAKRKTEGK